MFMNHSDILLPSAIMVWYTPFLQLEKGDDYGELSFMSTVALFVGTMSGFLSVILMWNDAGSDAYVSLSSWLWSSNIS